MEQADQKLINDCENAVHLSPEESLKADYNAVLENIGKGGKYQKILMMIFLIASFVGYYLVSLIPMMKELPDYNCFALQDFEDEPEFSKYKSNNDYQIVKDEECIITHCKNKMGEEPMPWILVVDLKSNINFVSDFRKFCSVDEFFGKITQFLFIGRMLGMFIFSYISDKYGRKPAYFGQVYITLIATALLGVFKKDIFFFLVVFWSGFGSQIFVITIVIGSELMDQSLFSLYNGLSNGFFPLCGLFNVLLVYFTKNWYYSLITMIVILSLAATISHKYIVETPSQLINSKRYKELHSSYEFIANENGNLDLAIEGLKKVTSKHSLPVTPKGATVDPEYKRKTIEKQFRKGSLKEMTKVPIKIEKPSSKLQQILGPYYKLLSNPYSAFQMFIIGIMFFNLFFIYFGLLYNLDKLEGNIYLHTAIVYISEMIAEFLTGYILSRCRRIRILVVTESVCLLCCVGLYVLEGTLAEIVLFVNSFFISINFVSIICYTAELFEPEVRNTATSLGINCGVLSLILMPYLLKISPNPFPTFIVMLLISLVLKIKLRETKLDDSVQSVSH